ncbi:MAG: ATP-binding cassette domain-containing protein [Paracoccaceae bacterium]
MLLNLQDVTKTYPTSEVPVLRGITLGLNAGEMMALTGESGSGKSTLLHLIGGLDSADSGVLAVDGVDLTPLDDAGRAALRRRPPAGCTHRQAAPASAPRSIQPWSRFAA